MFAMDFWFVSQITAYFVSKNIKYNKEYTHINIPNTQKHIVRGVN